MKKYYLVEPPYYKTDHEDEAANPIRYVSRFSIPSISCPRCGVWSSTRRLRGEYKESDLLKLGLGETAKVMNLGDWSGFRSVWADALNVQPEIIVPGLELGYGTFIKTEKFLSSKQYKLIHCFPGHIVMHESVMNDLISHHLTGFRSIETNLSDDGLNEFYIFAVDHRVGAQPYGQEVCDICGRTEFPRKKYIFENKADYDFFTVENNQAKIVCNSNFREIAGRLDLNNVLIKEL